MTKYYHRTDRRNLQSILSLGLLPRRYLDEIKKVNKGLERGMHIRSNPLINPDYVYLSNRKRTEREMEKDLSIIQLEIDLEGGHPLERDYDQSLILLYLGENHIREITREEISLTEGIRRYFHVLGVDFTADVQEIKSIEDFMETDSIQLIVDSVDKVSESRWAKEVGEYRTPLRIGPDALKVV
ncbi:hypothetical protein K8R33_01320 [archaeon]|nr:hypothetical protein [archaeon]